MDVLYSLGDPFGAATPNGDPAGVTALARPEVPGGRGMVCATP